MSFPKYKDIVKNVADIFKKDWLKKGDDSVTVEVTTPGPFGVDLTTTQSFNPQKSDCKIASNLALGWSHPTGFVLDKFEFDPSENGSFTTETSLTGLAPGLKVEFAGNDVDKGDLSFTYKGIPAATLTGTFDLNNFKKVNMAVGSGMDAITFGANADIALDGKGGPKFDVSLAGGYTVPKTMFIGGEITKSFKNYGLLASAVVDKDVTVASRVDYASGKDIAASFGGVYKCNASTSLKAKIDLKKQLDLSVKHSVGKGCTITAFSSVGNFDFSKMSFGCKAVIG
jgi:hypothetical protein